jgi:hypothetical protein
LFTEDPVLAVLAALVLLLECLALAALVGLVFWLEDLVLVALVLLLECLALLLAPRSLVLVAPRNAPQEARCALAVSEATDAEACDVLARDAALDRDM